METQHFSEVAKVQRFCLTLTGEARLWYESLRPIVVDWIGLQNVLDNNIQNVVICESDYSMCGDHFILIQIWKW